MRRWRPDPIVAFLTLICLVLRVWDLPGLGDLEFDEIVSVRYAALQPKTLLSRVAQAPFEHPPLFYLALGYWQRLFQDFVDIRTAEALTRSFSAVFGTLLVPLAAALGRRTGGQSVSRYAAFLAAFTPLLVFYGREVRMYALLSTLVALAIWQWWRALQRPSISGWTLFILISWVALYTHFLAIAVPLTVSTWLVISRWRGINLPWRAASVTCILALSGPLPWALAAPGVAASLPAASGTHLDLASVLGAIQESVVALGVGPIESWPWAPYFAAVWLLVVILGLRSKPGDSPGSVALFGVGLVVTLLIAGIVLIIEKPFSARYILGSLPFVLILGARGLARLQKRWGKLGPVLALLPFGLGVVSFGATYYTNYTRADYSDLTTSIAQLERDGDVVLLTGPWQAWYFDHYYAGKLFHHVLPKTAPPAVEKADADSALQDLTLSHDRLWLSLAGLAESDPERLVEVWLLSHAWQGSRQAFDTAELSIFKLRPNQLEEPLRPARFGAALELVGGLMEVHEVMSGDVAPFTFRFQALKELGNDYRVSLRLVGWDGQHLSKDFDLRTSPLKGQKTSHWLPKHEVEIRQGLWLPVGLAPGTYEVHIIVYDGLSLRPLRPSWPGDPVSGSAVVGLLDVTMPPMARSKVPDADFLPVQVSIANGWDHFLVEGIRSIIPEAPTPGDLLMIDVGWRAKRAFNDNHFVEWTLLDEQRHIVGRWERRPLAWAVPTGGWRSADLVFDRHVLRLPATLSPGKYQLRLGLRLDGGGRLPVVGTSDRLVPILSLDILPPQERFRRWLDDLVAPLRSAFRNSLT